MFFKKMTLINNLFNVIEFFSSLAFKKKLIKCYSLELNSPIILKSIIFLYSVWYEYIFAITESNIFIYIQYLYPMSFYKTLIFD